MRFLKMKIKLLAWNAHDRRGKSGVREWRMTERLGIPLLLFKSQFPCRVAENEDIPAGLWLKLWHFYASLLRWSIVNLNSLCLKGVKWSKWIPNLMTVFFAFSPMGFLFIFHVFLYLLPSFDAKNLTSWFSAPRCVERTEHALNGAVFLSQSTGLFISPSGISELDCATTKTDTAERSISIGRESLQVFFCTRGLGVLPGSTARG